MLENLCNQKVFKIKNGLVISRGETMIVKAILEIPINSISFEALIYHISDNSWLSSHIILGKIGNMWYTLKHIPMRVCSSQHKYTWMNICNAFTYKGEPSDIEYIRFTLKDFDDIFVVNDINEMIEVIKSHQQEVA